MSTQLSFVQHVMQEVPAEALKVPPLQGKLDGGQALKRVL